MREQKYWTIFLLTIISVFPMTGGCGQNSRWPEENLKSHSIRSVDRNFPARYNEYLFLMDDPQRVRFFKLQSDEECEHFLKIEGIELKKELNEKLKIGMLLDNVEALLGYPIATEVDMNLEGKTTQWQYEYFNGYRNMGYKVFFKNNKVTQWNVLP